MKNARQVQPISQTNSLLVLFVMFGVCLILMAGLSACSAGCSQPTQAPPSATPSPTPTPEGAALLESRCTLCHSSDRPKRAKKTRKEWEETVNRMIENGAQLTDSEKKVLVDYLAKTYKP